jgi:membrane protein
MSRAISFFQTRLLPSRGFQLLARTFLKWQRDDCLGMGAALSYYFLFSLFPILLIVVSVLGLALGPDTDWAEQILTLASSSLPPRAFAVIQQTLLKLHQQSVQAVSIGGVLMLVSASTIFGVLDQCVDRIWRAPKPSHEDGLATIILSFLRKKIGAIGIVLATSILLLISLLLRISGDLVLHHSNKLDALSGPFSKYNELLIISVERAIALLILFGAVALLLYVLPSTKVSFQDLWPGAFLATALMTGLQSLVSRNIIRIGGNFQAYGAIGGVMVLMLWIYISCQIFLIACELSYVYAYLFGSRRQQAYLP